LKFSGKTFAVPDADLQILYDGEALRNGSMDVRELAPALMALGDLCERTNKLLNGDDTKVSLRVHADFKRGSFQVHVDLVQAHAALDVVSALLPHDLKSAENILEFLFGGGLVVSVLEIIKMLKGEPIPESSKVASDGDMVIDFSGAEMANSTVIISPTVAQIYKDPIARKSVEKILKPLEREGIDKFEVHKDDMMIQRVTRDEVPYFQTSDLLDQQDEYQGDREGNFSIITASFDGRYKWRLFDGHARFTADIADPVFLERVNAGEKFGKGDVLVGTLHIRQWRDETGLHAEYKIMHVASIKPAPQPRQLPLR
jgi:hypothetical protein